MTKEKAKTNIDKLDFETALAELEAIVEKLSNGGASLEEMVELYQRGMLLKEHCNKKLADAKTKIEKIVIG